MCVHYIVRESNCSTFINLYSYNHIIVAIKLHCREIYKLTVQYRRCSRWLRLWRKAERRRRRRSPKSEAPALLTKILIRELSAIRVVTAGELPRNWNLIFFASLLKDIIGGNLSLSFNVVLLVCYYDERCLLFVEALIT